MYTNSVAELNAFDSQSLLEMGTKDMDFVQLSQLIGRKTGGISVFPLTTSVRGRSTPLSKIIIRGKAMASQSADLFHLVRMFSTVMVIFSAVFLLPLTSMLTAEKCLQNAYEMKVRLALVLREAFLIWIWVSVNIFSQVFINVSWLFTLLFQMGVILKDVQLTDSQRFKQFVSQSKSRMEVLLYSLLSLYISGPAVLPLYSLT